MKKIVKVLVGIPNEDGVLVDAYDNRMLMMYHLGVLQTLSHFDKKEYGGMKFDYPKGVEFEFHQATVGNVLTPIARQMMADMAVKGGFDYLFMIDDDMICPTDLFERLYNRQKDIIAPLAFMRFPPHRPVIYQLNEGYDEIDHKPYYLSTAYLNYPKDSLVECDAVGFGAILINCKVFDKLSNPWFVTATGAGEDIQFCYDARKAGFKVYMDTSVKLGHLGQPKLVTEETYEAETDIKEYREIYDGPAKLDGEKYDTKQ